MILDDLAAATRKRIEARKKEAPLEQVKEHAVRLAKQEQSFSFPFEKAIAKYNQRDRRYGGVKEE